MMYILYVSAHNWLVAIAIITYLLCIVIIYLKACKQSYMIRCMIAQTGLLVLFNPPNTRCQYRAFFTVMNLNNIFLYNITNNTWH